MVIFDFRNYVLREAAIIFQRWPGFLLTEIINALQKEPYHLFRWRPFTEHYICKHAGERGRLRRNADALASSLPYPDLGGLSWQELLY